MAGWELNLRTRRLASLAGEAVELSNGEFRLWVAFCGAPQRVLTREQWLSLSRLQEAEVHDRTIDMQIPRLRRKIEPDPMWPVRVLRQREAGDLFDTGVVRCRG